MLTAEKVTIAAGALLGVYQVVVSRVVTLVEAGGSELCFVLLQLFELLLSYCEHLVHVFSIVWEGQIFLIFIHNCILGVLKIAGLIDTISGIA